MNKIVKNRYFFQNEIGRDAFFIHTEYEINSDYCNVWTSIIVDLNQYFNYDEFEQNIIQSIHDPVAKTKYIFELAENIKREKSLHHLFLPEYFLNKDGKFSEESAITIANIVDEKTGFADYSLFSENCHPLHFTDFKVGLLAVQLQNGFIKISRDHWLDLIHDHPDMQSEYVEYYSNYNEFYYLPKAGDNGNNCGYFMCFDRGDLKYFFTKSTNEP